MGPLPNTATSAPTRQHQFAGDCERYCADHETEFQAELNHQIRHILENRALVVYLLAALVYLVNGRHQPQLISLIIPLAGIIFLPWLAKQVGKPIKSMHRYFDGALLIYVSLWSVILVQLIDHGIGLSNGPIQALLIVCGWFVYSPRFLRLLARNLLMALIIVAAVAIFAPEYVPAAFIQAVGGLTGGAVLAYVSLKNQQLKFYALSLHKQQANFLNEQLQIAQQENDAHIKSLAQQQEQIRSQLDQLSKLDLLAMVAKSVQMLAHDVRKPLSVLQVGMSMLRRSRSDAQRDRLINQMGTVMAQSKIHIDTMVHDVLGVGDGSLGDTEDYSILTLFNESVLQLFGFGDRHYRLAYDLNHQHCFHGNVTKARRVICNLLANAAEANSQVDLIRLITKEQDNQLVVGIFNNHSFIDKELQSLLFQEYQSRDKQTGTGLGLAIARQFVELHGGKIFCESSAELGTTFWFTLPLGASGDDQLATAALADSTEQAMGQWIS